jgi:hypothetical protein
MKQVCLIQKIRQNLASRDLLTIQGRVTEERYMWGYTFDEFIEGIEEGGFVSGDSRRVQRTGLVEHIGHNILQ